MTATVLSIHLGPVAPLGPNKVPSAFVKHLTAGPVTLGPLGLEGDHQADMRVHGGPEKAVYAYAVGHYPAWKAEFPEHADRFGPGSVGENLPVAGLTEADLCVGDVHAIGTAELQVCQPRQPCFKFALRFGDSRLPKAMVQSGRSGWYYRVLSPGVMQAGEPVVLRHRPHPGFRFDRLVQIVYQNTATRAELEQMAGMAELSSRLRNRARRALEAEPETAKLL